MAEGHSVASRTRAGQTAAAASTHAFPRPILKHLEEDPFILVSTHGLYDERSKRFEVPKDVYIFETQVVGDYCLTTIDEPLNKLLNDRDTFINCITANEERCTDPTAIQVFKQFTFYQPGDTIYNRILSIGGGKRARHVYDMDFYKYEPRGGRDPPRKFLQSLRFELSDEDQSITMSDLIKKTIKTYPPKEGGGTVFFFSSCAEPRDLDKAKILEIAKVQQNARLKFMQYTPIAPGGGFEPEPSGPALRQSTRLTHVRFHPKGSGDPVNPMSAASRGITAFSTEKGGGRTRRIRRGRRIRRHNLRNKQTRRRKRAV
jgi:hypothetical protein